MNALADPDFLAKVEAAVNAAEEKTDAEIVVALSGSSGSYRDVDHVFAAPLALATIALLSHTGVPGVEQWALLGGAAAYVFGLALPGRLTLLRRVLTTRRRRRSQAARAARLAFVEEGVHATQARHGVLLYASLFEGIGEVIPDVGLEGKVDPQRFYDISHGLTEAGCARDAIVDAIARTGEALAAAFPKTPGDTNEIPNAPRVVDPSS